MFGLNKKIIFKKGAMFGKLSQLDHINIFAKKKGAMFGLDARIALAIFGALSVISGAALYSAIQQSKVVSIVTDLQELGKAYEAYLLDTGQELTRSLTASVYDANKLYEDTVAKNWKGPYVPYTQYNAGSKKYGFVYPKYPDLTGLFLRSFSSNSWGGANVTGSECSSICYVWAEVSVPVDIGKAIDLYVDQESDVANGNVRLYTANPAKVSVFIKLFASSYTKDNSILN